MASDTGTGSLHKQTGICVQVSVNDSSKVEVQPHDPLSERMGLGDAFAFDASTGYKFPVGDWKGRLFFTAKGDPL